MCLNTGEGIAGKVAQTGEPVVVEDISKAPEAAHADLITAEGLKGFVSVPLKAKDKVVGVMNIASTLPGKFTKDDMYLLNSIGYQLGTAIEQAKLYRHLNEAKDRYQMLLRRALAIQEEERRRIARELHDETAQSLTALALNMQALTELMDTSGVDNPDLKSMLAKTHAVAVRAGTELTKLIRELRPTLLDTLGLPAALRRLAEANLGAKGIEVTTEFQGLEPRLPPQIELALFRITQEAISNIVRHAEARKANISVRCDDRECVLCVEDDGKGFDVSQITTIDSTGRGAGLFGMKERVTLIGGKCSIDSMPGSGTKVVAKVPVTRSAANAEDKSPHR
jgi:signal transduction histidine kinase